MQEKLLILRKRKSVSQKEVADLLGVSPRQYGLKERGHYEFTSDEMFKLKDYFGCSMEEIFSPRNHQNGDK